MAYVISQLKDDEGNYLYPISKTSAIYADDNQTTMDQYIKNLFQCKAVTLLAANWVGTAAPYSYDLSSEVTNNALIGFNSESGTSDQESVYISADINGGSGTKVYAYGDKPTVDIPVIVCSIG